MSHKSGHIIIESLKRSADITPAQVTRLNEIEQRDEYNMEDRFYLGFMSFHLAPTPTVESE